MLASEISLSSTGGVGFALANGIPQAQLFAQRQTELANVVAGHKLEHHLQSDVLLDKLK